MSMFDSLYRFFFSQSSPIKVSITAFDPWIVLFFGMNGLLLLCIAFFYRPSAKASSSTKWWAALINAMTFSFAFSLVQSGSLVSIHHFQKQGFLVWHLALTWALGLVGYCLLWRFTFTANQSYLKMVVFSLFFTLILSIQMLLTLSGINGIVLNGFNLMVASLCIIYTCATICLSYWLRFHAFVFKKKPLIASICAAVFALCAVLGHTGILTYALSLAWSEQRILAHLLPINFLSQGAIILMVAIILLSFIGQNTLKLSQRLEQEIKRNNSLATLNQGIFDAIVAFDAKGRITFFNQAAQSLFGWSPCELLGQSILRLISDEQKEFFAVYIKRLVKQKMTSVIGMHQALLAKHKTNEPFPVRIAIGPYLHQGQHCFAATISNIQELREQIQSQREHAKEYQSLIANLPCLVFRECRDMPPHWVYLSDTAKVLTGLSAMELTTEMGQEQFVQSISADDAKLYHKAREKAAKSFGRYDVKYRYLLKDKQIRCFWEIGYCYKTKDGTVWADGVIIDLSHLQEKRHVDQEHEDSVFVLSPIKRYQVETRLNHITEMTNSLRKIPQNKATNHYLGLIQGVSVELGKLMQSKRSNDARNKLDIHHKEFSLLVLSQNIFNGIADLFKDAQCQFDYHNSLSRKYLGDEIALAQILHNMLDFSAELIRHGKLKLSLHPNRQKVRIIVESYTSNELGCEAQKQLFDPFDTKLIEQMQGHLWFDLYSHGALLYVDLPLLATDKEQKKSPIQNAVLCAQQISALVIDDVTRNQHELNELLWRQGIKLTTIAGPETLEAKLKEASIDLLLIDAYIDSNIQLSQIRQWASKEIKIIALVFSLDEQNEISWLSKGYDGVVTKPFDLKQILKVLIHTFEVSIT